MAKCIVVTIYKDGQQMADVEKLSNCDDWCFEFNVKKQPLALPVKQAFDTWKYSAGMGCSFDYAHVHQLITDNFNFHTKLIASCISVPGFVECLVIEATR